MAYPGARFSLTLVQLRTELLLDVARNEDEVSVKKLAHPNLIDCLVKVHVV